MKRRFAVAVQLVLSICFSGNAASSELFGAFLEQSTPLFAVDQSTGALTAIGPTGFSHVADLTSDPLTGRLWGVEVNANQLLSIDASTGAVHNVVALNSTQPIVSLAFDPVTRRLYGNTAVGFGIGDHRDTLYAIDPLSGDTSLIGVINFDKVYALAFDQQGRLFGVSDSSKELISIDTATGKGTAIGGFTNHDINAAFDIASRPEDNAMFLADSSSMSLYRLNTSTAAVDLIGPYGAPVNIVGLAFLHAVPEPSTDLLLCAGLLALMRMRRPRAH